MSKEKETQKAHGAGENTKKSKNDIETVPTQVETAAPDDEKNGYKDAGLPEPTRYKDWEVKGRCSDF